ncbi:MAG TPA: hypothetical protein VFQ23_20680 [Anaerolineales bacterium]|nr:hypothetical protein [Anaerolineales bacterium]
MFTIKLDKINIVLLAIAVLLGAWSIFMPAPAGGFFPLVLVFLAIAYIRTIYMNSGRTAAIVMSAIIVLIPLALYAFYYFLTSSR